MFKNPNFKKQFMFVKQPVGPEGIPQLGWNPIANLEQLRLEPARNIQLNEIRFLDMNEKHNRSFMMLKNAITNYTLNLKIDQWIGRDTERFGASPLQRFIDSMNNKSATRIKFYPYKDIFSFTFYHGFLMANKIDLSYQIQGKFKVQSLLSGQFDKVRQKNLHSFKVIVPDFINMFKYEFQVN